MEGLFDFLTTPNGVATGAGAAAALVFALYALDTRREQIRKRLIELAALLSQAGFKRTPSIFTCLAVGDLSGAITELVELFKIYADPTTRQAELAEVFANVLKVKLADPNQAALLKKIVDDAQAAFASGDPAAAIPTLTQDVSASLRASPLGNDMLTHPVVLFPDLAKDPVLAAIAQKLEQSGLGALIPKLLQTAAPAAPAVTATAAAPAAA